MNVIQKKDAIGREIYFKVEEGKMSRISKEAALALMEAQRKSEGDSLRLLGGIARLPLNLDLPAILPGGDLLKDEHGSVEYIPFDVSGFLNWNRF